MAVDDHGKDGRRWRDECAERSQRRKNSDEHNDSSPITGVKIADLEGDRVNASLKKSSVGRVLLPKSQERGLASSRQGFRMNNILSSSYETIHTYTPSTHTTRGHEKFPEISNRTSRDLQRFFCHRPAVIFLSELFRFGAPAENEFHVFAFGKLTHKKHASTTT